MTRPTLRQLYESGELTRMFLRLKSWAGVAKELGVNEATLRRTRRECAARKADVVTSASRDVHGDGVDDRFKPGHVYERHVPDLGIDLDLSDWDEEPTQTDIRIPDIQQAPAFDYPAWNRQVEQLDAPASSVKRLTKAECPDGTMILWASDVHIPIHHEAACRLMVECAERNGVTRVVAGGDILDMNCLSKHAKESRRTVAHATILDEVEPGRWLLDWFATKQTDYILGNHEDRLKRFVDENPAFHGSLASNFAKVCELPPGINVLPQGGEVRLGNLTMLHLDAQFKNGSGGKYPAQRVLDMRPDESSIGGHVHRMGCARRTSCDEHGIKRTRCAWTMGHMSHEHMHYNYVSTTPNWQMGFGLIRVYWEGDRPRWTVYQIEVLFDRNNEPYFEFGGVVYGRKRAA